MLEAGEAIAQSRLHTGFLVSAARYPDRVALSIGQQQSEAIESILEISRLSSRGNRVSTRR